MDLEARKASGRALMSGSDCDYDPALLEDAFPINYVPNADSERSAVDAWRQTLASPDNQGRLPPVINVYYFH